MPHQLSSLTTDLTELESELISLLGRVERRQQREPAVAADRDINQILQTGLQHAMNLTQKFMAAHAQTSNLEVRAQTLVGLAHGMTSVKDMIGALEGEKHLSPLFDRIIDREYDELKNLQAQLYHVVIKDSADIRAALPPKSEVSQSPVRPPVTQPPAPLVLALTIMFMPVAIASGIMSGFQAGMRDAADGRKARDQNARPTTRPDLRLVQG